MGKVKAVLLKALQVFTKVMRGIASLKPESNDVTFVVMGLIILSLGGVIFFIVQGMSANNLEMALIREDIAAANNERDLQNQRNGILESAVRDTSEKLEAAMFEIKFWEHTAGGVVEEVQLNLLVAHSAMTARGEDIGTQRWLWSQSDRMGREITKLNDDLDLEALRYIELEERNNFLLSIIAASNLDVTDAPTPEATDVN